MERETKVGEEMEAPMKAWEERQGAQRKKFLKTWNALHGWNARQFGTQENESGQFVEEQAHLGMV